MIKQLTHGLLEMENLGNNANTRENFDFSIDYSQRAYDAYIAGNMGAYMQALADRAYKISQGYDDDGVTNEMIEAFLKAGGILGSNQYFSNVDWDKYGFDTGGYTGAWGSEGRLAMLHEKEIVLNKMDTANLLASVEIVRSIAQSIDAIGQYQRMQELISAYGVVNNPTQ